MGVATRSVNISAAEGTIGSHEREQPRSAAMTAPAAATHAAAATGTDQPSSGLRARPAGPSRSLNRMPIPASMSR